MRRRRPLVAAAAAGIALIAAGCGSTGNSASESPAATVPASVAAPVAVAPAALGGPVHEGPNSPAEFTAALKGDGVIVVGFVVPGIADDQSVAAALHGVEGDRIAKGGTHVFVYRVGVDKFGDLADVLGVGGTPAVAVIGRDRTLVNRFTGLVDADILRQAVSDAADTVAAHPSAGAATPAAQAAGALGDPAGIALAKQVRAAYAHVPGVAMNGTLHARGATIVLDAKLRLQSGNVAAFAGTLELKGTKLEMAGSSTAMLLRTSHAPCWASLPAGSAVPEDMSNPAIPLDGVRFSAPRRSGTLLLLDGARGTAVVTWAIDAATHRVRELRGGAEGTVTFADLSAAPPAAPTGPVCSDPSKALDAKDLAALAR